jgi:outer membrane beta-barrel protein
MAGLRAALSGGCAIGVGVLALLARPQAALGAEGTADTGSCVDQQVKADLDAKRRRRSARDRLVGKTNRHELGVRGGQYASDLFDATPVVGAFYSYHLTEDFAVEASGSYTRITSTGAPELERIFSVLGDPNRRALLFFANLEWAPLHAKMQTGSSVFHFDVYLTAGAGVVDSVLSSGVAGNGGLGFMFFLGRAVALRLEVRDHVYRQQLLTRKLVVNDVTATAGVSLLLPFAE